MSMNFVRKLPIPAEVKKEYPIPQKVAEIKEQRDKEIRDVLCGNSDKFLVIIGPCSADSAEPVLEYVHRLAKVQDKVSDRLILIPRVFTNKPRTTGKGYKGMIHQPDPQKQPDVFAGLVAVRSLHTSVIEETGLTTADEMLYPENYRYLDDVLSYVTVGARSVEDQHHRMTASGISAPVGMKNPTSGDLSVLLNSVVAAQAKHCFIYRGWEVNTTGNDLAHVVLRGAVNQYGNSIPNYHYEDLMHLKEMYEKRDLKNPAVIIDTNHSNSGKQYMEQIRIVREVLHSRSYSPELHKLVKGFMIESYLEDGAQNLDETPYIYGKSITDPCLGWEKSEELLYEIYEKC